MTENEAKIIIEGFLGDDEVINEALEMTVKALEEFKALKEKSVAKKVVVKKAEAIELDICDEKGNVHLCPTCNDYIICLDVKHCWNCGQALEH